VIKAPRFRVRLRRGGDAATDQWEEVQTSTPGKAASLAEKLHEGCEAVEVIVVYRIIGRCWSCKGLVFDSDAFFMRHGRLVCGNCNK
jgi:hypothetical protein